MPAKEPASAEARDLIRPSGVPRYAHSLAEGAPAIAGHQAGVFTRAQARGEGWSDHQIRHRLRTGIWVPFLGRSLMLAATRPQPLTVGWGAQLAVQGSVISHLTAGRIYGFPLPDDIPRRSSCAELQAAHVITDRHRVPPGVIGHRARLTPSDLARWSGVTVTTRQRTALDCLAMLSPPDALRLWAWLVSRRLLDAHVLGDAVRDRFGQHGTPALLRVLGLVSGGAASVAERRVHDLLRSAGIGDWAANAPIHDPAGRLIAMADVLFARSWMILEIDGYAAHSTPEAFIRDRRRQNALVNAGYRVLRISWADLIERPGEIIAEVQHALAR